MFAWTSYEKIGNLYPQYKHCHLRLVSSLCCMTMVLAIFGYYLWNFQTIISKSLCRNQIMRIHWIMKLLQFWEITRTKCESNVKRAMAGGYVGQIYSFIRNLSIVYMCVFVRATCECCVGSLYKYQQYLQAQFFP